MVAEIKQIVFIEDDEDMRVLVTQVLRRRGFEVTGSSNGREGIEIIRREIPDLVILDLMMPEMDGWDVCQLLKLDDKTRDIPVIILTAKAQAIDRELGFRVAKVDDYISKPFSPQSLIDSIERVLKNREKK